MKNKPTEFIRLWDVKRKGKRPEFITGCVGATLGLGGLACLLYGNIESSSVSPETLGAITDTGLATTVAAVALGFLAEHYENRYDRAARRIPEMQATAFEAIAARYASDTAEEPVQASEWLPGFGGEPPATEDLE